MSSLVRLTKIISMSIILLITLCSHASEIKPAMWQVEHQGVVSYLFGSMHLGKSDWYPLPAYITKAFDESSSLVVELDATVHTANMTAQMMLPAGQTLQNNLSPQTYKLLEFYLASSGMPIAKFTQFKPWAVATIVAVIPYLKAGLTPKFGLDSQFITRAKKQKIPLIELETPQFQIDLISGLFADEKVLIEMMELPDSEFKKLINFWAAGNMVQIKQSMDKQMTPEQRNVMLTKRNNNWVTKLTTLFSTNESYFVVVGAAHLTGNNGVPELLENVGMKVTRIK